MTNMFQPLEPRLLFSSVQIAAIGDFGEGNGAESSVARLVHSWNPDFIITTGDNNYPTGSSSTIDAHIGPYYRDYISPYRGRYGRGSRDGVNRFFPSLGNHDWISAGAKPYLNYFTLPGNEHYYTHRKGPVEIFAIDSNPEQPDLWYVNAKTPTWKSPEARWLRNRLAKSTARWKIVYFHHPPFSSGTVHGSSPWMRWPFEKWGATAVISGHEHNYERLHIRGILYFVNGSGGSELYGFGRPLKWSEARYSKSFGAMRITADDSAITFKFITSKGKIVDHFTIQAK